jgi:hypothetical protein
MHLPALSSSIAHPSATKKSAPRNEHIADPVHDGELRALNDVENANTESGKRASRTWQRVPCSAAMASRTSCSVARRFS